MIAATVLMLAAAAPPPSFIVERVVVEGPRSERVSVFRDGSAVLVRRDGAAAPVIRRQVLAPAELRVYVQLAEEVYAELRTFSSAGDAPGDARLEIRVAPPGRDAVEVTMPVTAVPSVAARRVMQAMDDLAAVLDELPGDREDLSAWQPKPGERLLLRDGREVMIVEMHPGSTAPIVEVSTAGGAVRLFYDLDELRELALRRIGR